MSGRGGRRNGKDRRPYLRLVPPVAPVPPTTGTCFSSRSVQEENARVPDIIEQVVRNLFSDAAAITDGAMVAISEEFTRYGLPLQVEDVSVVRDAVFEIAAGAFKQRLLVGLTEDVSSGSEFSE
jgi:hypothetical protein